MFKQMFFYTALLTRMLSIIILIVIPSIAKAVSCFHNIMLSTTLSGQKINQAVIVTVKFVIYFICLASSITIKYVCFRDIHAYFTSFLQHFVDPNTLSGGYNSTFTR